MNAFSLCLSLTNTHTTQAHTRAHKLKRRRWFQLSFVVKLLVFLRQIFFPALLISAAHPCLLQRIEDLKQRTSYLPRRSLFLLGRLTSSGSQMYCTCIMWKCLRTCERLFLQISPGAAEWCTLLGPALLRSARLGYASVPGLSELPRKQALLRIYELFVPCLGADLRLSSWKWKVSVCKFLWKNSAHKLYSVPLVSGVEWDCDHRTASMRIFLRAGGKASWSEQG